MLEIIKLTVGPVETNCYLIASGGEAAVIDPGWDGEGILAKAQQHGLTIGQIWYTHAHFDHFGGAQALALGLAHAPRVAMHPHDLKQWEMGGGGARFGHSVERGPEPNVSLAKEKKLKLGKLHFEVRHTPGHSPGHVVYYCAQETVLFSGDLIFQHSVGRTDIPGSDWETLKASVLKQVFRLPEATRILPGHGEETTVGEEKRTNPFVRL